MIFLNALGSAYFEGYYTKVYNLNYPIINQNGLSEWMFIKLSNEISQVFNTNQFYTKLITALSLLIFL